jgi:C1A family cysteine protease
MLRQILTISSLLTFLITSVTPINDDWFHFTAFQKRFSKFYESVEELETRFGIFRENLRQIAHHNSLPKQNFTLAINGFADLTTEEFKTQYASGYSRIQSFGCKPFTTHDTNPPQTLDWTDKGVVNSVQDQGQCGSCWAFATTANAESAWAISTGKLLKFSEQYLVDCAAGIPYLNQGCNGGQMDSAFKFMIQNGQCSEEMYPYVSGTTKVAGTCEKCVPENVGFSACYDVATNDQLALLAAVAKQPVVVAIEADTRYFQFYSGGILTSASQCGTKLDHAVEIVGYGTDGGVDYWKVRNSWSESWGMDGYVLIERSSSTNDVGVCGVAAAPSFIYV